MRSNVSNTSLVALLRDWNFEDKDSVQPDSAERLSQWLNPRDAISLHAAHLSIQAVQAEMNSHGRKKASAELDVEFRHIHGELLLSLALNDTSTTRDRQARNPMRQADSNDDAEPGYALYRQHHLEQQRRMEGRIASFRRRCRQVLAHSSLHHRQLAELDTSMEQIFGERERALLSKLPSLLERRFHALKAIQLNTSNTTSEDFPLLQNKLNGWIDTFEQDFQAALRAELSLRLEPVAGMVEAFSNEAYRRQ